MYRVDSSGVTHGRICHYDAAASEECHFDSESSPRSSRQLSASVAYPEQWAMRLGPSFEVASFTDKLKIYGQLMGTVDFGTASAANFTDVVGLGISNGGYMAILSSLSRRGNMLPVVSMAAFSALSSMTSASAQTYVSHRRDNQDLFVGAGLPLSEQPKALCRNIAIWGLATWAQNAVLTGAALGYRSAWLTPVEMLMVGVVCKSVELCVTGMEKGYWDCIKVHLGSEEEQKQQRAISRTIVGVERIMVGIFFNAASIGVYASTSSGDKSDKELMGAALAALIGGGLLSLSSKLYFWQRGEAFH
jgi:hypothetical protein